MSIYIVQSHWKNSGPQIDGYWTELGGAIAAGLKMISLRCERWNTSDEQLKTISQAFKKGAACHMGEDWIRVRNLVEQESTGQEELAGQSIAEIAASIPTEPDWRQTIEVYKGDVGGLLHFLVCNYGALEWEFEYTGDPDKLGIKMPQAFRQAAEAYLAGLRERE